MDRSYIYMCICIYIAIFIHVSRLRKALSCRLHMKILNSDMLGSIVDGPCFADGSRGGLLFADGSL